MTTPPYRQLLVTLLLVDCNPLANIELVAEPAKNFVVIMKNGVICKNARDTLSQLT